MSPGPRLLLPALVAAALSLPSVPAPLLAQVPSLDERVEGRLGTLGSGLAAGVFHDGEVLLMKAWGTPSHGSADTLTTAHLFPFPAFTEVLIGVTVRSLHAAGALDANAPVGRYLPELAEPLGRITVDDLLRHTGGLDDAAVPPGADLDAIVSGLDARAVLTRPGVIYSYSRSSFPLVARVLERVTGLPLAEAIGKALFGPLGMELSTFDVAEADRRGLAAGYLASGDTTAPPEPAGQLERLNGLPVLYTNVPEVLRFLSAWQDGLLTAGPDALPEPPRLPPIDQTFADGLWRGRYQLLTELERTTRDLGHSVVARAYPETGTVIVVWTNGEGPLGGAEGVDRGGAAALPWEIAAFFAERLIGPDIPVRITEEVADTVPAPGADRVPLWAWAGHYVNGDRVIVLRPPETEGIEADLVFFNGSTELPLERLEDGSVLARLPEDGRPVVRFRLVRDGEGRKYLFYGSRAYRLVEG